MGNATITFPLLGEWATFNFSRYFEVFGFKVYWYGVIIAFGFLLGAVYAIRRSKEFGLTEDYVLEMLICAVPAAIVFARLYFVVFATSPDGYNRYFENPVEIFAIRDGGLAIYGGVIGAVLAVFIYARLRKVSFGSLADLGGLGLLIGQAVGRWANFVNRECYGYATDVPWKMGFTQGDSTMYVHPTFLYESLWNVIGFVLLHIYTKKRERRYKGQIFVIYLGWYGLGRFFIEGMRTDSLYFFTTGLRASQVVAILCLVGSVLLHIFFMKRNGKHAEVTDEAVSEDNGETEDNAETENNAETEGNTETEDNAGTKDNAEIEDNRETKEQE